MAIYFNSPRRSFIYSRARSRLLPLHLMPLLLFTLERFDSRKNGRDKERPFIEVPTLSLLPGCILGRGKLILYIRFSAAPSSFYFSTVSKELESNASLVIR